MTPAQKTMIEHLLSGPRGGANGLGERGVVDLIGVMGWYQTVSMLLNTDRYPMAEGTQAELKPLK
jgi:hypothetical protein